MKALIVFGIMIGVIAMLAVSPDFTDATRKAGAIAANYAVYRNAVFLYARSNKNPGDIQDSNLKLPQGWVRLRTWKSRIENSRCYVFGPASAEEIAVVRDIFTGSIAVGMASRGQIQPQTYKPVLVPAFVLEGSLVSVIEVK